MNQKEFLVLQIIAFDSATTNCQDPEQDTCHWQSKFYETQLRFNVLLREIFLKSVFLRVIQKYYEGSLKQILQEFGTL